jgi:hypothetical protein
MTFSVITCRSLVLRMVLRRRFPQNYTENNITQLARAHFLFLNSISSLWLQTYSKPVSRSARGNYALVQEFSGHRDIASVAVYIHLRRQYFLNGKDDEYNVEIARTIDEASKLIAVGFDFVHEYNGVMIYRKRK